MTMTMMMTMVMMLWIVGSVGLGLSSLPALLRQRLRLCRHCLSPVGTAALLAPTQTVSALLESCSHHRTAGAEEPWRGRQHIICV